MLSYSPTYSISANLEQIPAGCHYVKSDDFQNSIYEKFRDFLGSLEPRVPKNSKSLGNRWCEERIEN